MYYNFNNFTGRLTSSANFQPYYPLSPSAVEKREPPKIIFSTRNQPMTQTSCPAQSAPKTIVPGTNTPYGELTSAIRGNQMLMQKNDGIPIFLKGGAKDKVLFGITVALCAIGLAQTFYTIYKFSYPKKPQ